MFGISFEELLVLMILALILFGPEKLPEYAEKLGRLVAKLRQSSQEVTRQFYEAYHGIKPANPFAEPGERCPHCNHRLEPHFLFCPYCGSRRSKQTGYPHSLAS
jgi:hypothetical protein|uniref:Zinc-ribbon domain-containing protein n=1 Tax=Desulfobacca acetoxidans TaxID=60893 RepID=A0A7C3WRM5_9BACT